jgi:uncharacterized protein YdhG (YjbR/CyaY superfamily)
MNAKQTTPQTIDEYIAEFPADVQRRLQRVRKTIVKAAPGAEEMISYRIPAFKLSGYLVYFAGHTKHIGLYPAPRGNASFKQELAAYKGGKGTVQFPHDEPLPLELIGRIVKHRVQENLAKTKLKASAKAKGKTVAKAKVKAKKKPH